VAYSCLFPDRAYRVGFFSTMHGQISLGQSLRRTVDLFYSVRGLVEEDEQRSRLEEDGLDIDSNEE
jgi:hypothetical protein